MTQVTLSLSPDFVAENAGKGLDCPWKDCQQSHEKKIAYKKKSKGTVEKNGSYANDWVKAGHEPWVRLKSAGKKSFTTDDDKGRLKDYRLETPKAKYAVGASKLKDPEYHTQKHHLISISLFKTVKKVTHDAKLVGYDANHKNNGACFPTYELDIVRHDLQCHRGNHPIKLYNDQFKPYLDHIQNYCVVYCAYDADCDTRTQEMIIDDLNDLSEYALEQIKAWKWLLRSDAKNERIKARARAKSLGLL